MPQCLSSVTIRSGPPTPGSSRIGSRLRDEIAEIHTLSVDLNEIPTATEADMLMLATYRTDDDLAKVRSNPRHQEMIDWYLTVALNHDRREVNFITRQE